MQMRFSGYSGLAVGRRRSRLSFFAVALLLTLFMAGQATAALTTYDVTFTVPGPFTPWDGVTPSPFDPVTGSFTITIDPSLDYPYTTTGISLNGINIDFSSPLAFWYNSTDGSLSLGGTISDDPPLAMLMNFGTDDFMLIIGEFPSLPVLEFFSYAQESLDDTYWYVQTGGTISVTTIPLPATLPLLGSGLLGLAGWRRFRRG